MSHPKVINWDVIDSMLIAGCNGKECAATIGIHPETLYDRCVTDKATGWSEYCQSKKAQGLGMLRTAQFQKAYKEKNPTMLIWLGKQMLQQKEDATRTVDGETVQEVYDLIRKQEINTDVVETPSETI